MELKKMVSTAAKAVGVSSTMKTILSRPVLRDITYKYSALVGDVTLTADGKPLLQAVLQDAANKYNASSGNEAEQAYVDTLIESSSDCLANRIVVQTEDGEIAWNLLDGNATDFLEKYRANVTKIEYGKNRFDQPISRAILMVKILPPSWMEEHSKQSAVA